LQKVRYTNLPRPYLVYHTDIPGGFARAMYINEYNPTQISRTTIYGGSGYANTYETASPEDTALLHQKVHDGDLLLSRTIDLIGSDPEIFAEDAQGACIPAFKFLPDKNNRRQYAFWDGYQGEFITEPNSCLAYFVDSIRSGLKEIHEALPKGGKLSLTSVFPIETLYEDAPEHVALGCAPSQNIYGDRGRLATDSREIPFRFAGCHLHFSFYNYISDAELRQMLIHLDGIYSVCMTSFAAGYDNPIRRMYYGLAGEYRRPSPKRFEYRTPSNIILSHPGVFHMAVDFARACLYLVDAPIYQNAIPTLDPNFYRSVVNNSDVDAARKWMVENQAFLTRLIKSSYDGYSEGSAQIASHAFSALLNGIDSIVTNPRDIAGNWLLSIGEKESSHEGGYSRPMEFWSSHSSNLNCQWQNAVRNTLIHGGKI
jgi:hypothetical protein